MLKLQEIIYRAQSHVGPLKPVAIGTEDVNSDAWFQQDGKTFLRQGPTALDITDMLTGEHPKFALVEVVGRV